MSSNMTNQIFFFCKQQFYLALRNVERMLNGRRLKIQGVIGSEAQHFDQL